MPVEVTVYVKQPQTKRSSQLIEQIAACCRVHSRSRVRLTVVDVSIEEERIAADGVLALPSIHLAIGDKGYRIIGSLLEPLERLLEQADLSAAPEKPT